MWCEAGLDEPRLSRDFSVLSDVFILVRCRFEPSCPIPLDGIGTQQITLLHKSYYLVRMGHTSGRTLLPQISTLIGTTSKKAFVLCYWQVSRTGYAF